MENIVTAIVGGLFDEGGVSAFSRPVLFGTAGDATCDALPKTAGPRYFICQASEHEPTGTVRVPMGERRMDALAGGWFRDTEHVLVIDAPLVPEEAGALARLVTDHLTVGYEMTVLAAKRGGFDAEGTLLAKRHYPAAVFSRETLHKALKQGAACLNELVEMATAMGALRGVTATGAVVEIKDGEAAFHAQRMLIRRINFALIKKGVQLFDPAHTYIAPDAEIEAGATILPGCHIRSGCSIGAGAVIGPNAILEKASIGAGTSVNNSQVYESRVGKNATVGPYAYIRPGCTVGDNTRIGDFVELKKASIGDGTKVSHLTYVGDAEVGERVNFGCGTVVVNYDGYRKTKTVIGDDCFIGCNTNLVSPVTLGDRVFTAAGTTVTKDVPDGALTVARARQSNIEGWNDRRRASHGQSNDQK